MDGMECGTEVTDFLAELRSLGEQPPPFPSPELSALLVGGIPISSAPSRHRPDYGRRFAAALVAASIALVVALAAENTALSTEVDHFVSNVVTHHPSHNTHHLPAPSRAPSPKK
jgi:hypothetical protein